VTCPEVICRPRTAATAETELSSLAAVYRFVLDRRNKTGSSPGAPDAAKGSKHDSRHHKCTG
jgi:hypothetical protein